MNVTAVESSTLSAVAYDENRAILQLEFGSRAIYRYFDVPASVHAGLIAAASKGRYFNLAIRGRFRYAPAREARVRGREQA
ncbi:MAG TPA: KTSC domain-containing protein [Acidobacteriaceae bacterium]|nr:KTSC domain-containing protein [Acidobacteriaceae bacterium]